MQRLKIARNRLEAAQNFNKDRQYEGSEADRVPLLPSIMHNTYKMFSAKPAKIFWSDLKEFFTNSYVNLLLIIVPIALLSPLYKDSPVVTFVINFIAIIPLAARITFLTEEVSINMGQIIGGLVSATFGNIVELIISIVAVKKGELRLSQTSLLGSIICNMLFVLGCCFVAGGVSTDIQNFNPYMTQTVCGLLMVSLSSILLSVAFDLSLPLELRNGCSVLMLSRVTSVVLLIIYIMFLVFQVKTHRHIYSENDDDDKDLDSTISLPFAIVMLIATTVIVTFCSDNLVSAIDPVVEKSGISKSFIGLIIVPIMGNAAEHSTAVVMAYKSKMDLAINVALGSSIQISLFLLPFITILGWIIKQPFSLQFQPYETVVLFVAVMVVSFLIMDGKTHWFEGAQLLGMYIIVAFAFLKFPD